MEGSMSAELEWECTPQKGLEARPCPNRRVPLKEMPGVPMPYQTHRRIGLHTYAPGYAHEAFFDLVRVNEPVR
jgi:hypothetical protein